MGTPGYGDFGSAYHPTDHSRPQYLRQDHVPPDGFQAAPLERRWRPLLGRLAPWARPLSKAAVLGARICVLTSPWGDKLQESLLLGERGHIPSRRTYWRTSGRFWRRGQADQQTANLPRHLAQRGLNIQDPDYQFPRDLEQGVPLRVTDPPLTSPGIWPLKKELEGENSHSTGSELIGAHFWKRSPWAWWRAPSVTSTWGLALAGAGHQVGAAQGGRHQGPPESEGPQQKLAVPGGLTGGRMVGEQGRHLWHG